MELAGRIVGSPALRGVQALVLHGSRARGDAGPGSDWDFGVLTDGTTDLPALVAELTVQLGTDAVDVVDLERASALMRFRTARDGVVVVEPEPGRFLRFRLAAVGFWCDAGPVIRAAQANVLAGLG